jgi:hypothetical protein
MTPERAAKRARHLYRSCIRQHCTD